MFPFWENGCPAEKLYSPERVLQGQGLGGAGAGGRAEKLKLGKQSTLRSLATEDGKAEIAGRTAGRSAAAFCPPHLPVRCALLS